VEDLQSIYWIAGVFGFPLADVFKIGEWIMKTHNALKQRQ
jgi:hypothetical protein